MGHMWVIRMPVIALPNLWVLERTYVRFGSAAVCQQSNNTAAASACKAVVRSGSRRTSFYGQKWTVPASSLCATIAPISPTEYDVGPEHVTD
jgi:hypothetical protein